MRRAALFAPDSSFLAVVVFAAGNAFLLSGICGIRCRQCSSHFGFVVLAAGNALLIFGFVILVADNAFSFLPFVAFGTGNAFSFLALWHSVPERASYGTEYAFGAQNRLLGYATHFLRHSV